MRNDESSPLLIEHPRTAREVAWLVVEEWRTAGRRVNESLDDWSRDAQLSSADRGFALELSGTTIRRQMTLDTLLGACVRRPKAHVEPEIWSILQLGACQLTLMDGVAEHAAINETVALAKRCRLRWGGFVNGVLRQLQRLLDVEPAEQETLSPNAFWRGSLRHRRIAEPLFPDPRTHFAEAVAHSYSLPIWIVSRWAEKWTPEQVLETAAASNRMAPLTLRANRIHIPRESLLAVLHHHGIECVATEHPDGIRLEGTTRVDALPGYAEGWFSVQDEVAMQAATRLKPSPGERIWDMCAAPGGKTGHLAELMEDRGEIIATDTAEARLDRVRTNLTRLGITCVETQRIAADGSYAPDGLFDAILLDVPCSNTGVLGKRPEVRWRLSSYDLFELPEIQQRLIALAASRLKPGGRLLYSTCSLEAEENEKRVAQTLTDFPALHLADEAFYRPTALHDGGYQALLVSR